jgi:S1-C subfamily serine protease
VIRVTLFPERPAPTWIRTIPRLPFAVRPITPELGVVVTQVDPESQAAEVGLRAGDVVREINRYPIRTISDVAHIADTMRAGDWIAILVQRGRTALYVAVIATRR